MHGPLRHALRAATRDRHDALDRAVALTGDALDRDRYVDFLQRSLAAIAELEEPVMRFVREPIGPSRRACLTRDLAALGAAPRPAATPSVIPITIQEGLGCAYVLEGSTLGGVVLAEAVESKLCTTATSYLRLRGEHTARAWRSFLAQLDEHDARFSEDERRVACAAAQATFDHYRDAFEART